MITVHINDSYRVNADITESWINRQINERVRDRVPVCVKVEIEEGDLNMGLSTPSCIGTGKGGRPPNKKEQIVYDLWDKHNLHTNDFSGGNLIAFLKQIDML